MQSRFTSAIALATLTLLGACAALPPKIDASPAKLAAIRTIAVIRSPEPRAYAVHDFRDEARLTGLIGGLLADAEEQFRQKRLMSAYQAKPPAVSSNLADHIAQRLRANGFVTIVEDAAWDEVGGSLKLPSDKITSSADAVLVTIPTTMGFAVTRTKAQDYQPVITAVVTLLGKDRKEELYKGFHASGYASLDDRWRLSPATASFANFEALIADPNASSRALLEAAGAIASTVGADLRR